MMTHPGSSQEAIHADMADQGEQPAGSGPLAVLCGWLIRLRDFSPFAFASADLEQKYQDYQSVHVPGHVGVACLLLGALWAFLTFLGWHKSIDYPQLWLFSLPVAVCFAVTCFSKYAPGAFRGHWQAFAFAITTMHMLMDEKLHAFVLALDAADGKPPWATLLRNEFRRLLIFMFHAHGFPLSLPALGLAYTVLWVSTDYSSTGRRQCTQGLESQSVAWIVSNALRSVVAAYGGPGPHVGPHVPGSLSCRVWIMIWRIQVEVIGAVVGVLSDIAWRRSFLRSQSHLLGPNGAARAAAWPFESPRTIVTCTGLLVCLLYAEIMAFDIRVTALLSRN